MIMSATSPLRFQLQAGQSLVPWKTRDDAPVRIEESSGNVFADLGLKYPEELLAKVWLVQPNPFSTATVTNAKSTALSETEDLP
jgi:hypothetical protein